MPRTLPFLLVPLLLAAPAPAQVGELDPSFHGDGIRVDDFGPIDEANGVALQEDGAILVFGASYETGSGDVVPRLTRYHPDGSLDQSWTYGVSGGSCGTPNLARLFSGGLVDDDGTIVTVGYRQHGCGGSGLEFEVTRIDPGTGGIFDTSEQTEFDAGSAWAITRQPDGKIVAAGKSSTGVALARYLPDLGLDTTFGGDGEVVVAAGDEFILTAVAVQDDGKIVAVGDTSDAGGDKDFLIVRLDGDGTLDATFGTGGKVVTDFFGFDDVARGLAVQDDGKLVVVGTRRDGSGDAGFTVVRYEADGALDTSFSTDGLVVVDFAGLPANATHVALQADGEIVAIGLTETGSGGTSTRDVAVARLSPTGAMDPAFAADGKQTVNAVPGQQDIGRRLVLQPYDGHPVVVGQTVAMDGEDEVRDLSVIRLISDSCGLDPLLELEGQDVDATERFEACDEIAAGNGFRVLGSGDVTFRAGDRIVLQDGFEVQSGGSFRAVIE